MTHEFSHSWNGKYRRPADLTTPNFQVPQLTDLLWVYEGMNQYLGDLLSFRSGIREPKLYPEYVASVYADMDSETGRSTTPLIDLTTGAPYFYLARGDYRAIRRNAERFLHRGRPALARRRYDHSRALARRALARHVPPSLYRARRSPVRSSTPTRATQVEACSTRSSPTIGTRSSRSTSITVDVIRLPTNWPAPAGASFTPTKPNEFIAAAARRRSRITGWYAYGANLARRRRRERRARGLAGVARRARRRACGAGRQRSAVLAGGARLCR